VDTPRHSPRTNRTRRVPHPVLIGRATDSGTMQKTDRSESTNLSVKVYCTGPAARGRQRQRARVRGAERTLSRRSGLALCRAKSAPRLSARAVKALRARAPVPVGGRAAAREDECAGPPEGGQARFSGPPRGYSSSASRKISSKTWLVGRDQIKPNQTARAWGRRVQGPQHPPSTLRPPWCSTAACESAPATPSEPAPSPAEVDSGQLPQPQSASS
jgi:hypothetical protein